MNNNEKQIPAWSEEQVTACCDRNHDAAPADLVRLVDQLQSDPDTAPSDLLKERIMHEVASGRANRSRRPILWQVAAVLALALIGALLYNTTLSPSADPKVAALDRGLHWLIEQQQENGAWQPSTWGGNDQYANGVTALSLMALLQAPETTQANAAISRSTDYLVNALNAATPRETQAFTYNHSLATLALLHAHQAHPAPAVHAAIDTAVQRIIRQQSASGGWGYAVSTGFEYSSANPANSAITAWPLAVLKFAGEQGWDAALPVYNRASRWMAARIDDQGQLGYRNPGDFPHGPDTLLAIGLSSLPDQGHALTGNVSTLNPASKDMYEVFFTARALSRTATEQLATLQNELIDRQTGDGGWETSDKWAQAGGRIYATAMASMSLGL